VVVFRLDPEAAGDADTELAGDGDDATVDWAQWTTKTAARTGNTFMMAL
jgi:hypothetical protein